MREKKQKKTATACSSWANKSALQEKLMFKHLKILDTFFTSQANVEFDATVLTDRHRT
jgi:hypothetical protein